MIENKGEIPDISLYDEFYILVEYRDGSERKGWSSEFGSLDWEIHDTPSDILRWKTL